MATAEQFREAKNAVPFQPFSFRLVDGTVYTVKGRDWISVPPAKRAREMWYYAMIDGADPEEYETHRIDLSLVTEVILPPNGQAATSAPTSEDNGA
jgi:hypothetical protein